MFTWVLSDSAFFFFWGMENLQYNFEGRYDLVKFVKLAAEAGLYVHLRIGPYVCAEWNYGSGLNLFTFFFWLILWFYYKNLGWLFFEMVDLWNSGFPVWLHFVPGIKFRTDNEPFKVICLFVLFLFIMLLMCKYCWLVFCRQKCSDSLPRLLIWWSKKSSMHHKEGQLFSHRWKFLLRN